MPEASDSDVRGLAELAGPIVEPPRVRQVLDPPSHMGKEQHEKWWAQKQAERQKLMEEDQQRRDEAASVFKVALDKYLAKAYQAGGEDAVSTEERKAIDARSYVLWGVVLAVVSMPIIGMLLNLDPQTFGAFIAPVTGIAGTVVGYWFGTVGQVPGPR